MSQKQEARQSEGAVQHILHGPPPFPGVGMSSSTDKADGGLLRISADKVGRLMDLVNELSLGISATLRLPELEGLDLPGFEAASHRLSMMMRDVQNAAAELRMVEVDEVFRRLRRMIREMERETEKTIQLAVHGEDTLVDKLVADRLYEPLLHVLRNSADHGLEKPEARLAAGKTAAGTITLAARQTGNEVRISVSDDGRGLDYDRILRKAQEKGVLAPDARPAPADLWPVIFLPGFSTAETVSTLSGRGVGMDVLNTALTALRGRIGIESEAGQGTTVSLYIPLTLSFLDCVILRHGPRLFAIPVDLVTEILRPAPENLVPLRAGVDAMVLRQRGRMVPVVPPAEGQGSSDGTSILVVVETTHGPLAIAVDEVLDRQQVVMKPLTGRLVALRASWGLALLSTGEVATVLDCERLVQREAA